MTAPMHIVVRPLDNPRLDAFVEKRRALSGNQIIQKKDAARQILKALAAGDAVQFAGLRLLPPLEAPTVRDFVAFEEHVEVVQSFKDDPLTVCPSCGGPLRKVFGSIGIAFKGSGFYKTDHRDSASIASSEKDEPASASDGGKTETTKPASDGNGSADSKKPAESGSTSSTPSSDSKPATTTSAA